MDTRLCRHCGHEISVSALFCPAFRRSDEAAKDWLSAAKTAGKWAFLTGLALVGPNAIVGALIGPELNRPKAKKLRRLVGTIQAVDSVHLSEDVVVYFTKTGFLHWFLYDLGRNPVIPPEIPYRDFLAVNIYESVPNRILGGIEYRTPSNWQPPARPKPRERLLLGKELYEQLSAEAAEYEKNGPPPSLVFGFEIEGELAEPRAQLVTAKFSEYAGT